MEEQRQYAPIGESASLSDRIDKLWQGISDKFGVSANIFVPGSFIMSTKKLNGHLENMSGHRNEINVTFARYVFAGSFEILRLGMYYGLYKMVEESVIKYYS